jgi:hypothetical protein
MGAHPQPDPRAENPLEITGIQPEQPSEGDRIELSFYIDGYAHPIRAGRVVARIPQGQIIQVQNLPANGHFNGIVQGLAPEYGQQNITIAFYDPDNAIMAGEFEQPNLVAGWDLAVGATYTLTFDNFRVEETRSRDRDTDGMWVSATVGGVGLADVHPRSVFDPPDPGILSRWIGGVEDDDVKAPHPPIEFGPQKVMPDSPPLVFGYEVVNAGYGNLGERTWHQVTDSLSDVAEKVLDGLYPSLSAAWSAANGFTHILNNLEFADCDGIVVMDHVEMQPQRLADATGRNSPTPGHLQETRPYAGYNAPDTCGPNSNYYVTWTVRRTSWMGDHLGPIPQ